MFHWCWTDIGLWIHHWCILFLRAGRQLDWHTIRKQQTDPNGAACPAVTQQRDSVLFFKCSHPGGQYVWELRSCKWFFWLFLAPHDLASNYISWLLPMYQPACSLRSRDRDLFLFSSLGIRLKAAVVAFLRLFWYPERLSWFAYCYFNCLLFSWLSQCC